MLLVNFHWRIIADKMLNLSKYLKFIIISVESMGYLRKGNMAC